MDVYAWATRLYARCRVLSVKTNNRDVFVPWVCLFVISTEGCAGSENRSERILWIIPSGFWFSHKCLVFLIALQPIMSLSRSLNSCQNTPDRAKSGCCQLLPAHCVRLPFQRPTRCTENRFGSWILSYASPLSSRSLYVLAQWTQMERSGEQ